MQLILPEYLGMLRTDMSTAGLGTGLALGVLLWLFGWLGHRFWIVLAATAAAGIVGLYLYPTFGITALLISLLLAVSAGMLALSLVRVVAFGAGGVALWLAVRTWIPVWNEPLIAFLVGGLAGVLLFRLWTMAVTSFAGTLLMAYFGLSLLERLAKLDAVVLVESKTVLVNWVLAGLTLLGLGLQLLLDRWRARRRSGVPTVVEAEPREDFEEPRLRNKPGRKFVRRAG